MKKLPRFAVLLAVLCAFLASCARPSRDDKITARDDDSFALWLSKHESVLSADDLREINEARQQIRYKVMQEHPGMMSDVFAQTVYADIDGKTPHELVLLSYAYQVDRYRVEIANYAPLIERYEKFQANPNLTVGQRQDVEANLAKLNRLKAERIADLERVTKRLAELKQTPVAAK